MFNYLYQKKVSPLPLAVFRILFSFTILLEVAQLFYFKELFFDNIPYLQPSQLAIEPLLAIWATSLIFILLAWQTRYAALINYLCSVYVLGFSAMNKGYDWHVDSLFLTGSLLLLFMPVDRALSLQSIFHKDTKHQNEISFIYQALLMLIIGGLYLDSMLWKLSSGMYLAGLGFWAPASLPYNSYLNLQSLLNCEPLVKLMGYTVLAFEFLFIFLIWFRKLTPILVFFGIVFHVGISFAFPIPIFGLLMLAFLSGMLPSSCYQNLSYLNRKQNVDPQEIPLQINNRNSPRLLFSFCFFTIFSFLVLGFASPINKIPLFKNAAKSYKKLVYPWTGFSTHAVFFDPHFSKYNNSKRLVFQADGQELELPLIGKNGSPIGYNHDRVWVFWTFRTVKPDVKPAVMKRNLLRFVNYWAFSNAINISKGEVLVLERPVEVSLTKWKANLLDANQNKAWYPVGSIKGQMQDLRVYLRGSPYARISLKPEIIP